MLTPTIEEFLDLILRNYHQTIVAKKFINFHLLQIVNLRSRIKSLSDIFKNYRTDITLVLYLIFTELFYNIDYPITTHTHQYKFSFFTIKTN